MLIDDKGVYGGGSDHNWLFLSLDDKFVKQTFVRNTQKRKEKWDFDENFDWTSFRLTVSDLVKTVDIDDDVDLLASSVASILLDSAKRNIGMKKKIVKTSMLSKSLPVSLLHEIEFKRFLERDWKTKLSEFSSTDRDLTSVQSAEKLFLDQQLKVKSLLADRRSTIRSKIVEQCSQKSIKAVKCFWSHVNSKVKKSADIRAVISSLTGTIKCNPEDIKDEVAIHLLNVFKGSFDSIPVRVDNDHEYCANPSSEPKSPLVDVDHSYTASHSPKLPVSDGSGSLETDPTGWMDG